MTSTSKNLINKLTSVINNDNDNFMVQYLSVFELFNEMSCTLLLNKNYFLSGVVDDLFENREPVKKHLKEIAQQTIISESILNRLIVRCEEFKEKKD
jgi:hypothetical protein